MPTYRLGHHRTVEVTVVARVLVLTALLSPAMARSQAHLFTDEGRRDFAQIRDYITRTAEKMPESKYSLRPVPEVRTFRQIIAHIADDQYTLCAAVKRENRHDAYSQIEKTLSAKAVLARVWARGEDGAWRVAGGHVPQVGG